MNQKREITIGLIQMRPREDQSSTLEIALVKIEEAAAMGAQIVVLPELFQSPYFCQKPDDKNAFNFAESIPGPASTALALAAAEHGVVVVGGSIFEKTSDGKFFNTTPVFGPEGESLGMYRKTHIPEDILYHEQHYFAPGDTGIKVFDTPFGKICPLICYDQWFPEAARIATLQGAELIVYPTAIGVIDGSVEENITGDWEQMWRNVMLGHAAANNVYVAGLNRVGREGAITFWGGSFVADPSSKVIALAGKEEEEILIARMDLARVKPMQDAWRFLNNRRPDMYSDLIHFPSKD
jgi:predicted amidohydrolase